MKQNIQRLRMFAGPNGSGKSTIKSVISNDLLGIYVNADEIEKTMRESGSLDLTKFQIACTEDEILSFFNESSLLKESGLLKHVYKFHFNDNQLTCKNIEMNAYFAAVAADFIRHRLLDNQLSFTFETVMSSKDKLTFLAKAKEKGVRNYLYYIATEDPSINISRVQNRVIMGGHPVPEDKIISRYYRSLELLKEAVQLTHRAYIFDNSGLEQTWLAEITNGTDLEVKADYLPSWFERYLGHIPNGCSKA